MTDHPKDRSAEPDDPFEVHARGVEGDPELMLDCLVEEYSRMGFGAEEIVGLFEQPEFLATHGLRGLFGARAVRERISAVLARCGVLRVSASTVPTCDPSSCRGS